MSTIQPIVTTMQSLKTSNQHTQNFLKLFTNFNKYLITSNKLVATTESSTTNLRETPKISQLSNSKTKPSLLLNKLSIMTTQSTLKSMQVVSVGDSLLTTTEWPLLLQTKLPLTSNDLLNMSEKLSIISEKIWNISEKFSSTSEELWAISKKLSLMSEELLTISAQSVPTPKELSTTLAKVSQISKKLSNTSLKLLSISTNLSNKSIDSSPLLNELSLMSKKLLPMLKEFTKTSTRSLPTLMQLLTTPSVLSKSQISNNEFNESLNEYIENSTNTFSSEIDETKKNQITIKDNITKLKNLEILPISSITTEKFDSKKINFEKNSLKSKEVTDSLSCNTTNLNNCLNISIIEAETKHNLTSTLLSNLFTTTKQIISTTTKNKEEEFRLNSNEVYHNDSLNRDKAYLRNLLQNVTLLESFNDFGSLHRSELFT